MCNSNAKVAIKRIIVLVPRDAGVPGAETIYKHLSAALIGDADQFRVER